MYTVAIKPAILDILVDDAPSDVSNKNRFILVVAVPDTAVAPARRPPFLCFESIDPLQNLVGGEPPPIATASAVARIGHFTRGDGMDSRQACWRARGILRYFYGGILHSIMRHNMTGLLPLS